MTKYTKDDFDDVDREAFDRALALVLDGKDRERAAQVKDKLETDGWFEAAGFASYVRQGEHLSLAPWEESPCHIDPDDINEIISRGPAGNHKFGSAKLAKRLLTAKLSLHDPTPVDSLAAATRRRK